MRQYRPFLDETKVTPSRFDVVIEWLLVALLAFMPLAFGVVHAWSEEVVIAISGIIVVCFLLKLIYYPHPRIIWTWAYVPVGLFLLVASLQLVPLPASFISIISPNTATLKTELLGDLPNADRLLGWMTLSFYPNATRHDLRLVLAVAGVFVVVLNVFRHPDQVKRLLTAVAVIGCIIAVVTLAQNLFGNGKIYWFISNRHSRGYSGPFINHSNYGQFMNLSIGAALGLLIVKLHEGFIGKKITPPVVFEYLSSKSAKPLWLLMAAIGLGAATVFASLTRGGIVSMLIALTFTTLLFTSRRSMRGYGWIMVVIALIAFACVLYVGFDAVYDRLAAIRDIHEAGAGRLQMLEDIMVAWFRFPILGTGLGTHSVVYPMFDRSTITALAAHAENEYAQTAEEMGLVGLVLLIIFGIIIWSNYVRNIRGTNLPICSAVYGLGFGILAILIHSLSDFGQHLPANACLSVIFCALLIGLARQDKDSKTVEIRPAANSRLMWIVVLLAVSGIWVRAFISADNARVAAAYWAKALEVEQGIRERNWQATEAEYADLISCAAAASSYEPENIKYRYWLNVYRWHSISKVTVPHIVGTVIDEDSIPTARDITEQLNKARLLCPTYGPTYSVVGQIEKYVLGNDSGEESIRKGFRLAPCDPVACFVAGCLDILEGRSEEGVPKFARAVQLDGRLFNDVARIYVNFLSRPHLAVSAAGDDIAHLNCVANLLEEMQYSDLAEQSREKAKHLLEAKCSRPEAPTWALAALGEICAKQQDYEGAINYYRRALTLDYGQVQWRLSLARLLAKAEKIPEAVQEARICLRLRPQWKEAEKLVTELSVDPAAFGDEIRLP